MNGYSTATNVWMGGGSFGAFIMTYLLIVLVIVVLGIIGLWRVFTKAGKPGWAAIIPFYNLYVLLQVVGRPGWWFFAIFLPIIPIIGSLLLIAFAIVISIDLAKAFGKTAAFGVIGLWLFSVIGVLILGFGDAKYVGASAASANTKRA